MDQELTFPKTAGRRKRKKHKPSVLHAKDGTCFLCMYLNDDYRKKETEEHHIFYGPNREVSEREGLKVYLCHSHHQYAYDSNLEAVHGNPKTRCTDLLLKQMAQRAYERKHTREQFMELIGRSYL